MNATLFQMWQAALGAAVFVAALTIIVVGATVGVFAVKGYRRFAEFGAAFRDFLTVIAAHGALTDANARVLTQSIIEALKPLPAATAALAVQALIKAGMSPAPLAGEDAVPDPPPASSRAADAGHPTPPVKAKTDPNPPKGGPGWKDSVRLVAAASAALVGVGLAGWACLPYDRPGFRGSAQDHWRDDVSTVTNEHDPVAAGLKALQEDRLADAEREFSRAGDHARQAEVRFRQGRYDEALALCKNGADGQARFWEGMVARERGDHATAADKFLAAKGLGSETGAAALSAFYPGRA